MELSELREEAKKQGFKQAFNMSEETLNQEQQVEEQLTCPICMDDIFQHANNFMRTECGHCFHSSCLIKNIDHNGFDCPYCRAMLIEVEDLL